MKLLLTSGGVSNRCIHSALVRLLGKPIEECRALCVPTAQWGEDDGPVPQSNRPVVTTEAAQPGQSPRPLQAGHLSGLHLAAG